MNGNLPGNLRGILTGTAGLSVGAIVALLLTILRTPAWADTVARDRTARLFSIGLAAQCLHFTEEFVSRFQYRFPALLGSPPWSDSFFVVFNLTWLSVWILSAIGIQRGYRIALFPAWFFAIASITNGIAHPALSVIVHGYFPGLFTSPLVGVLGLSLNRSNHAIGKWMSQLESRTHRNVLVVAVANKLARITWAVLSKGEAYCAMPVSAHS